MPHFNDKRLSGRIRALDRAVVTFRGQCRNAGRIRESYSAYSASWARVANAALGDLHAVSMRPDVNENGISWELSASAEVGSLGSDGSVAWLKYLASLASAGENNPNGQASAPSDRVGAKVVHDGSIDDIGAISNRNVGRDKVSATGTAWKNRWRWANRFLTRSSRDLT